MDHRWRALSRCRCPLHTGCVLCCAQTLLPPPSEQGPPWSPDAEPSSLSTDEQPEDVTLQWLTLSSLTAFRRHGLLKAAFSYDRTQEVRQRSATRRAAQAVARLHKGAATQRRCDGPVCHAGVRAAAHPVGRAAPPVQAGRGAARGRRLWRRDGAATGPRQGARQRERGDHNAACCAHTCLVTRRHQT